MGPIIARTLAGGYHCGVVQTIPQPSPATAPPFLLVTRPAEDAARLTKALARAGAPATRVVLSPLLRIAHVSSEIDALWPNQLIFTSAHGVAAADDAFSGRRLPCHVVGARTAEAAQALGHPVLGVYKDSADLLGALVTNPPAGRLLHLRGRHARGDIAQFLINRGIQAREAILYDQVTCPLTPEAEAIAAGETPVIIPLFSPRTAAQFRSVWPGVAPIHGLALSDAVAAEVTGMGWTRLRTAPEPTLAAMVTTIVDTLRGELG